MSEVRDLCKTKETQAAWFHASGGRADFYRRYFETVVGKVIKKQKGDRGMSQEELSQRETLKDIINDILEEKDDESPVAALDDTSSLTDDLGLDSLDLAEMTVRLEDRYGVDVFAEEVVDEVGEVLEKLDS